MSAYLARRRRRRVDHRRFSSKSKLKVVFTNIHGVGGVLRCRCCAARVDDAGCRSRRVRSTFPDGEIAESGKRGGARAGGRARQRAGDDVLATDPDCDRMGFAVRNRAGKMELLTGNQIGALLAGVRIAKYKELGWIPRERRRAAAMIEDLRDDAAPGRDRPRPRREGHQHAHRLQMDRRQDARLRGSS